MEFSPLQSKTFELLRRSSEPVLLDQTAITAIVDDVTSAIDEFAERLDGTTVFLSKHRITSVLGCEVLHLAPDEFVWKPAIAGGQIAHRAVQLLVNWAPEPTPAEVVEEAIARVGNEDTSLGNWVGGLSAADLADLRGFAIDKLIKFEECFPPIPASAAMTVESSIRWPVAGPIVLSGKVDLTLGRPRGAESTKVLIDLKTGWQAPQHRDDLRFYALVETLRTRVPPRKLASFYLDAGEPVVEDVTEGILRAASRRTLDAVHAEIELTIEGRAPVKRPGTPCRWCPLAAECAEGQAFLSGTDTDR